MTAVRNEHGTGIGAGDTSTRGRSASFHGVEPESRRNGAVVVRLPLRRKRPAIEWEFWPSMEARWSAIC